MLEAKLSGQEIKRPEPIAPAPVVDLMEALRASVAQAQKQKAPTSGRKKTAGTRKKTAARS
jgi:DNA end-binding protein Ku